jgi:hypothetical protein
MELKRSPMTDNIVALEQRGPVNATYIRLFEVGRKSQADFLALTSVEAKRHNGVRALLHRPGSEAGRIAQVLSESSRNNDINPLNLRQACNETNNRISCIEVRSQRQGEISGPVQDFVAADTGNGVVIDPWAPPLPCFGR